MKTMWYSLAFGISVTLHATLLLFGDPTHRAEIPVEQGHATLAINLVASVQSQPQQIEVTPQPEPEPKKVPDTFIEDKPIEMQEPTPLAAPVIEHITPTLPALSEQTPVIEENVVEPEPVVEQIESTIEPIPVIEKTSEIKPVHEALEKPKKVFESQQTDVLPAPASVETNTSPQPQGITTEARIPDSIQKLIKTYYPMIYRVRGVEGTVLVQVNINSYGEATQITVIKSSGHKLMDKAAIKTCREIRYIPALENGRAVESVLSHHVVFRLQSDS